jgi:hypothetical protein
MSCISEVLQELLPKVMISEIEDYVAVRFDNEQLSQELENKIIHIFSKTLSNLESVNTFNDSGIPMQKLFMKMLNWRDICRSLPDSNTKFST